MRFLLDTCLISELVKRHPNPGVTSWVERRRQEALFISVLTIGELCKGVAKMTEGSHRDRIRDWIDTDVRLRFRGRVLAIDEDIASDWGTLQGESEKRGVDVGVIDGLLAATAARHHLMVVTRNVEDFSALGVETLNPWKK